MRINEDASLPFLRCLPRTALDQSGRIVSAIGVSLSLRGGSFPRVDDPDDIALQHFCIDHKKNTRKAGKADGYEPSGLCPIWHMQRVSVSEDCRSFFERNPVLRNVGSGLSRVPFKASISHGEHNIPERGDPMFDSARLTQWSEDRTTTMATTRKKKAKRAQVAGKKGMRKNAPKIRLPKVHEQLWNLTFAAAIWKSRAVAAAGTVADREVARILTATLGAYARDDLATLQKLGKQASAYMEDLQRNNACEVDLRRFDGRCALEFTSDPFPRPNAKGRTLGKKATARSMMNALAYEMTQGSEYQALAESVALGLSADFAQASPLTQGVKHTLRPRSEIVKALVPKIERRVKEAKRNLDRAHKQRESLSRGEFDELVERVFFDALRCANWSKDSATNLIRDALAR
jgi:hypothetical protein